MNTGVDGLPFSRDQRLGWYLTNVLTRRVSKHKQMEINEQNEMITGKLVTVDR